MNRLFFKRVSLALLLTTAGFGGQMFAQTTCPADYDDGVRVGCNLARQLNENGCYTPSCATVVYRTFDRYYHTACQDYAIGVIDGYNRCNSRPAPRIGRTNPGDDDCEWVNGIYTCG